MYTEIKIGRRRFGEFFSRVMDLNNCAALVRMLTIHQNPVKTIIDEVFSLGEYPRTLFLRTPTGTAQAKLFSPADLSTLNLIFCRGDYHMPKNSKVVIDIGSNIGLSALFWLTRNLESHVYCFEPSPLSYQRLEENLGAYSDRITLSRSAVSDIAGVFKLGLDPSGVYSSLDLVSKDSVECQVVSINEVLEDVLRRHDAIDVLKIDSEGHEIRTLKAIKPEFWKYINCVNVDTPEAISVIPSDFNHSHVGSAERFWR